MKKSYLFTALVFIPSLVFGVCTTEEKNDMKRNGYSVGQISDICSETGIKKEEQALSTANKSYVSIEAAYVGESGPGFYEYEDYYGDTTENLSVSGSGISIGLGYTFDRVGHIKLKYKKLTSSWEDDYGYTIDGIDITETTLSWTASTNPSGDVHFEYGAFIGFGSAEKDSDPINFFTYGPEIGLIIDATDNFEIFTDLTWQQRSYDETNGVTITNFPFGLNVGLRYNFR